MNTTLALFFGLAIIFGVVNGIINPGPTVPSSRNLLSFLFWDE